MHDATTCLACKAADDLGYDETGRILFHQLIQANVDLVSILNQAESVGLDFEDAAVEAAVDNVLDLHFAVKPELLN